MADNRVAQCESCAYFDYDDEYDCYMCTINIDQDDCGSMFGSHRNSCPYYSYYDEYKIVRKQN